MKNEITTKMSPEGLEVANAYLEHGNIPDTALALAVDENTVSDLLSKREVKTYIDNVYLDKSKLDFISKASKGKYYSWDDRNKVLDNLGNESFIQNIKEVKKFRHIMGFLLILLFLLFTEWSLRKRKGLS